MVASTIGVWPTISRMTLSAAAFTVFSGSRTLNRKSAALPIRHSTTKLMSMMFSSPVSISASSLTSRALPAVRPPVAWPAERKPTSTRLTRVTGTFSTASIGAGRW